jgi:uncharacterized protein YoxC
LEFNGWWVAVFVILGVFVGVAIPVLIQLRQTLKSMQIFLDKTGRRLDEALDEVTEVVQKLNKVGAELEEGAKHMRVLFDVAGDVGRAASTIRDSLRTGASTVSALVPAIAAAVRAIWPPKEERDRGDEGGEEPRAYIEEDAPSQGALATSTFGGREESVK